MTEQGESDSASLTVRGLQRAGGLCRPFLGPPQRMEKPATIIASGPVKKDGSGTRSRRPSQTIAPLAKRIGVEPDLTRSKGEEALAANAVERPHGKDIHDGS
ncbi:hypothetical protein [Mesorhizobium australicum]|uniref:hypothetical protein n=1 Tax=Mesorhizobium australicum TaxID=536018 RepID=UPI0033354C07